MYVAAVRGPLLAVWGCLAIGVGCAPLPPPRAIITVTQNDGPPRHAVLAMPTVCTSPEARLCNPSTYYTNPGDTRPRQFANDLPSVIEPIVRLKLELAGYTLADARQLQLSTVSRTETTAEAEYDNHPGPGGTSVEVGESYSVADLPEPNRIPVAHSLGFTGELDSTLRVFRDGSGLGAPIRFELVLQLRAVPENTVVWTVRCSDVEETPFGTAELVASCAGDGVLAWRAPDAIIGGAP